MGFSEIVMNHFALSWKLFDRNLFDADGSMFLIEPFEQYFSKSFVISLTENISKTIFHKQMKKWGQIEQNEHEVEIEEEFELPDGKILKKTRFKDPEVRWARQFIVTAFYNLCSLGARKKTIEQQIYTCNQSPNKINKEEINKAFFELIGISNSFLSAEWSKEIIHRAVSNRDEEFFRKLSKWLKRDIPSEKFDIARTWLGTTMLWYLGGKDLPRREFMLVLRGYGIISRELEENSFNSELSKLKLIK